MATRYNPSIRQEPRYQITQPIDRQAQESILDWLDLIGRLLPREVEDSQAEVISKNNQGR